jgi:hypothetical protein
LCVMLALCPCRRIAVEVFDASCFCINQQQPLGGSVMRIQLLNACGWQVRGCVCVGGVDGRLLNMCVCHSRCRLRNECGWQERGLGSVGVQGGWCVC